jgi:hypothetical protein
MAADNEWHFPFDLFFLCLKIKELIMFFMKKLFVLSVVIFSLLFCVSGCTRGYHLSPGGDDGNPGTQDKPWRSIEKVNATDFEPGDRILFEGGEEFPGTIILDENDSGTKTDKVVVTSYGSGRATINGGKDSGLVAGGSHIVIKNLNFVGAGRKKGSDKAGVVIHDCEDVEVDNIDVSGFLLSGLQLTGVHDGRITNVYAHENGSAGITAGASEQKGWCKNLYIAYCVAENNPGNPRNLTNHSGNGIVLGRTNGALIEFCEAFNNGWDMPRKGNGPVGIWAWDATDITIQFCIAHDNKSPGDDGGGFDLDGGIRDSVLQYNLSYNNDGPGYFLCQYPSAPKFKNAIVRYNISQNDGIKNNRRSAIDIFAANDGMSDCEIYNNTVYNSKAAAVGFGGIDVPNVVFRNNIFVCAGDIITGEAKRGRFENNIYWPAEGCSITFDGHETFEAWVAATGQEKIAGSVVGRYVDPKLIMPGTVDITDPTTLAELQAYRLKVGSPCIGAGVPIEGNGGRDYWGNKLPEKLNPHIGACQRP